MKKYMIVFFISLFLCFSLPVHANEYEILHGTAVINTDSLNVRSGPSKDYQKLGILKRDTMVQIIGIVEPDWYVIEYGGEEGYVHKDYVEVTLQEETVTEEKAAGEAAAEKAESQEREEKASVNFLLIGTVVAIVVVLGAMILTLVRVKDEDEYEDYDEDAYEDYEEEKESAMVIPSNTNIHSGEVSCDMYRIDIDPIYFENTTTIPQPESVFENHFSKEFGRTENICADSLKEETNISGKHHEDIDSKLEEAAAKIEALQKEVEELKKNVTV